jgi:hypothetical protein
VDAELAARDVGFAAYEGAVFHAGGEGDVRDGGGVDAASGGEDLRGGLDGLGEISSDVGERGEEEVSEGVAFEIAVLKAILKEAGEEVLIFGERDHAVADVSGRQHFEIFAETAGGATVVRDGDDSGEVADDAGEVGRDRPAVRSARSTEVGGAIDGAARCHRGGHEVLQATKERGKAGSPADGYDAEGWLRGFGGGRHRNPVYLVRGVAGDLRAGLQPRCLRGDGTWAWIAAQDSTNLRVANAHSWVSR